MRFSRLGNPASSAGNLIVLVLFARGVFAFKKVWLSLLFFGVPHPPKPISARGRARTMGGAARRPDKSELGASISDCSDVFYQKFLNSAVARKKGKGENESQQHSLSLQPLTRLSRTVNSSAHPASGGARRAQY